MTLKLNLGWTPQEILAARDRYRDDRAEMRREHAAFESGKRIAAGDSATGDLDAIIKWKSPRPLGRIKKGNSPLEIAEALRVAVTATQVRTAVGVLCGLNGVDVAMASAMLTAIKPDMFTVIDWRALNALGVEKSWLSVDDYLEYLRFCKAKAAELEISLRELDQALWVLGGA
jgi:hypothetical protein